MDKERVSDLVTRSQQGDTLALQQLLRLSEPAMQRLAARVCPAADVDDAVQEVLFRVSEQVGALRVTAAFFRWSMRMLVRECLRLQKQAARWLFGDVEAVAPPTPSLVDITRLMGQLSPTSREILIHREVLGRTAAETAELLGITLESAKSRLRRARAELRARWTD